jgi:four helix bundle protein
MDFVSLVYDHTVDLTSEGLPENTFQIRAAAVSIPANIAKGHGMFSVQEFAHHLGIAQRALSDVETLLRFASRSNVPVENRLVPVSRCATQVRREITSQLDSLDLTVPN